MQELLTRLGKNACSWCRSGRVEPITFSRNQFRDSAMGERLGKHKLPRRDEHNAVAHELLSQKLANQTSMPGFACCRARFPFAAHRSLSAARCARRAFACR